MQDSRDFARLPIKELVVRCALPATISMGAMALYSVIDGVFVGYFLGETALAAINLVFPLFMLFTAVIDMLAAGSAVQVATRLGEGHRREASRIFSFSLVAIVAVSTVVALLAFIGTRPLLTLMGAEPVVVEQAATYLYILAATAPLCLTFFATDNYLRICGWQNYSMALGVGVAVLNIALDYLTIVVLGWGIAGAAGATACSIGGGAIAAFLPFLLRRTELRLMRGTIPLRQFWRLAFNGSSEFFDNTASSFMDLIVNTVLLQLGGTLAVAAFSVVMYLDSVVSMLVFGLTTSLQPALSYCHGAGIRARTRRLQKAIMLAAGGLSITALVILQTAGPWALTFFVEPGDTALMTMSEEALAIFALSYLVKWVDICVSGYFTALERPAVSLGLSLLGTLIAPLAALAILVPALGLTGVWYMPLCAGTLSALLSIIALRMAL
ncbi:MAG: MATE family efflux transporter [Selenomonadaceae bacterium]|nr:MATE family efflux transporter [Selenomonadaceae bacterium]MDD7055241.1 MATE family efflux transporter [Selenomonadaceae bacterium]MDY3916196.1 MATE family efflux transporter [Selenomonadaceae bacterium]